jgi:hypothetical protein
MHALAYAHAHTHAQTHTHAQIHTHTCTRINAHAGAKQKLGGPNQDALCGVTLAALLKKKGKVREIKEYNARRGHAWDKGRNVWWNKLPLLRCAVFLHHVGWPHRQVPKRRTAICLQQSVRLWVGARLQPF